jgi:hypothetical protein
MRIMSFTMQARDEGMPMEKRTRLTKMRWQWSSCAAQ